MEATLVWAGTWTTITVSGLLLIPVCMEFCKHNLPICLGITLTMLALYALTPYSAGARAVWAPFTHCAEHLGQTLDSLTGS